MTTIKSRLPKRTTTDVTITANAGTPSSSGWPTAGPPTQTPGSLSIPIPSQALTNLARKSQRLTCRDDITLRLPHAAIQALAQQARFWESCIDELPPRLRSTAPPSRPLPGDGPRHRASTRRRLPATGRHASPTAHLRRLPQPHNPTAKRPSHPGPRSRLGPVTIYRHLQCPSPRTPKATDPQ